MTPDELRAQVRRLPARTVLALTVWGEARGEPVVGQVAVAWVIVNRARYRRQKVPTVCLAKWQFSCWWEASRNRDLLFARVLRVLNGDVVPETRWLDLLQRCHQVLVDGVPDPTGGADHYLTTALYASENRPTWAGVMPVTATIGRHTFLRDLGDRPCEP